MLADRGPAANEWPISDTRGPFWLGEYARIIVPASSDFSAESRTWLRAGTELLAVRYRRKYLTNWRRQMRLSRSWWKWPNSDCFGTYKWNVRSVRHPNVSILLWASQSTAKRATLSSLFEAPIFAENQLQTGIPFLIREVSHSDTEGVPFLIGWVCYNYRIVVAAYNYYTQLVCLVPAHFRAPFLMRPKP